MIHEHKYLKLKRYFIARNEITVVETQKMYVIIFLQTYGSENKKGVGIILQRALLCQYAVYTLLVTMHINMEALLILLRQNPIIAR